MALLLPPNAESTLLSASGAISAVPCNLIGFYVNNTNAGTIVLRDGGSGGTAMGGTITPAIGWHFWPVKFKTSAYFTKGGTTINVTFVWMPR